MIAGEFPAVKWILHVDQAGQTAGDRCCWRECGMPRWGETVQGAGIARRNAALRC
jgi:hypothetical protein